MRGLSPAVQVQRPTQGQFLLLQVGRDGGSGGGGSGWEWEWEWAERRGEESGEEAEPLEDALKGGACNEIKSPIMIYTNFSQVCRSRKSGLKIV